MSNEYEASFPSPIISDVYGDIKVGTEYKDLGGLTKREYFAIRALQGILSNPNTIKFYKDDSNPEKYCKTAVRCAKSLLAELDK